ncbi:unnamed protein product [Dimorphilus gyrociliatus]|uniref:Uncharacterized protein n=1 Tax=Dimorphilus gyrociliatus TaxID=2664684 RepID=A0A7I8VCG1_9ANNE|nr:unnamed protein product [Dimorphilus gyrociliatus]
MIMYVESLRTLSIVSVVNNLSKIYEICVFYKYRLPIQVSNSIFEHLKHSNYSSLSNDDLMFFSSNVVTLTNVSFCEKQIAVVKNFEFLRDHPIEILDIKDINELEGIIVNINPRSLRKLSLRHCLTTIEQTRHLGEFLKRCCNLECLDLSFNSEIGENLILAFDGLRSSCAMLKKLDLCFCEINGKNAQYLGRLLRNCEKLESLDLSLNCISDDGFRAVRDGFRLSCLNLKKLYLSHCSINDLQTMCLGSLLQNSKNLESIDLSLNQDLKMGFKDVCYGLKLSNCRLRKIDVSLCLLNEQQAYNLADLLQNLTDLEELNLGFNTGMESGFKAICTSLRSSFLKLKNLYVNNCSLNRGQVQYLGNLLKNCKYLHFLYISYDMRIHNEFNKLCHILINSCQRLGTLKISYTSRTHMKQPCLGKLILTSAYPEHSVLEYKLQFHKDFTDVFKDFSLLL